MAELLGRYIRPSWRVCRLCCSISGHVLRLPDHTFSVGRSPEAQLAGGHGARPLTVAWLYIEPSAAWSEHPLCKVLPI